jgi:hypothetical protein
MTKMSKIAISALLAMLPIAAMATDAPKSDVYAVTVTSGNRVLSGTLGLTKGKVSAAFKGATYHYSGMVGTLSDITDIKYPKSANRTTGKKAIIHDGYVTTGTIVTIVADHGAIHVLYNETHLVRMQTKTVDGMTIKFPDTVSSSDVDNIAIHKGGTANITVGNGVVIHITRN